MINESLQSHDTLQHVRKHCMKFQAHVIRHKDFTKHGSSALNKSSQMTKQQRKILNKLKMHLKIPEKFTCILNIHKLNHAKIQLNWHSTSMETKFKKLDKT